MFLAYASKKGVAFADRALYLPKEWAKDADRRAEAGVPDEVEFANKLKLAKRMLERAFAAGVPARWVVANSFYGRSHEFREWLECPYAVMVPKTNAVPLGGRKEKIEQLVKQLPEDTFVEELVRVCQNRWAIEVAFEAAKGEVGLDHCEVRRWEVWRCYITLYRLAHAFLIVTCLAVRNKEVV